MWKLVAVHVGEASILYHTSSYTFPGGSVTTTAYPVASGDSEKTGCELVASGSQRDVV